MPDYYNISLSLLFLSQISASSAAFQDGAPRHLSAHLPLEKNNGSITRSPTYSPTVVAEREEVSSSITDDYSDEQKRKRRVDAIKRRLNSPTKIKNDFLLASFRESNEVKSSNPNKIEIECKHDLEDSNKLSAGLRASISKSPTFAPHDGGANEDQDNIVLDAKWPTPSPRLSRVPSETKSPTLYENIIFEKNSSVIPTQSTRKMNNVVIHKERQDDQEERIEVSKRNVHLVKINSTKSNYNHIQSIRQDVIVHLDREENSYKRVEHPIQYPSTVGDSQDEKSESNLFSSLLQNEAISDF